ncbi:hypothetical protein X943_000706 [Babesia divergens]|uniref:ATPTG10-like domain-containing protein n=1 Tax=Babesia divergens TaxID=32595 RepID=A0AAD9LHT3_BABDI|nr:hypothetical protein X943_000706 [Babesia divergens]
MAGCENHSFGGAYSKDTPGSYVRYVTSDINHLNKYANAAMVGDRQTMIKCFNSISWDDKNVLNHLPKYCEADHTERQLIDDIYRVLCPSFDKVQGPSFSTMSLWLKARLHMQHQKAPLSPVKR